MAEPGFLFNRKLHAVVNSREVKNTGPRLRANESSARLLRDGSGAMFWIVIAAAISAILFLGMRMDPGPYDEGLIFYGALKVLHGGLPYRDFWTLYAPGQFYLLAGLFRLFGTYAVLGRVIYAVTMLATMLTMLKSGILLMERRIFAMAAVIAALLWNSGILLAYLYPGYQAACLTLISLLCLILRWKRDDRRWIAAAGAAIAVLLLFRHDQAFYVFVALACSQAIYDLVITKGDLSERTKHLLLDLAVFTGSMLAIDLPLLVIFFSHVSLADVYLQLIYIPGHIYPSTRRLPLPSPLKIVTALLRRHWHGNGTGTLLVREIVYLPYLVAAAGSLYLLSKRWRDNQQKWQLGSYVGLVLLMLVLPISGLVRSDQSHQVQSIPPCLILLACLISQRQLASRGGRWLTYLATAFFLVSAAIPATQGLRQMSKNLNLDIHPSREGSIESLCHPLSGLERASCMAIDPAEASSLLYVEQHTNPGEKIFVGNGRHDKVVLNDIGFYFFSDRDAATKWYQFDPGVETSYPIQMKIIHDLESNHVVYVVRNTSWDDLVEQNQSRFSSGVMDLDRYIDANYALAASFGPELILRRRTPFQVH